MNISLFGFPIFKYVKIIKHDYKGIKIVLFGTLMFTVGIGVEKGYHHHISIGVFNIEIFLGFAIKDRMLP
jgi:hypothetical protein